LQLHRARHLDQLRPQGSRPWLQQAGRLHRQGRAAGHDATVAHELRRSAYQRQRVHARVPGEAPVLDGDQQRTEQRRNPLRIGAEPPDPARRRQQRQRAPLAIGDFGA
jgi:hypothetical protein